MARTPRPVHPRRLDERRYEKRLRDLIIAPYISRIEARISETDNYRALILGLDEEYEKYIDLDLRDVPDEQARLYIGELSAYHKDRMESSFRAAMGVNIAPVLQDIVIRPQISAAISSNVDLIKSIPAQMHGSLKENLEKVFLEKGFDKQAVNQTLQGRYKVTGSRAKIIARDQTSKTIGSLTKARHQQIGIRRYTWRTSGDERVRPTHSLLDGTVHSWDSAPSIGHPGEDILCRCIAEPVIE